MIVILFKYLHFQIYLFKLVKQHMLIKTSINTKMMIRI